MLAFGFTIFTGAFLLFQVQPLMAKYILPWFGGGPGVWTTCLMFFQVALLVGYAYAHALSRWVRPRGQALVHLALLAGAVAFLPITPSDAWKPKASDSPVLQIVALLTANLGLPYVLLASTGPLLQHWFSRTASASPYRLYALSNAGSLLALLSYPFIFEPHLTRNMQARMWSAGLVLYALACAGCALKLWRAKTSRPGTAPSLADQPALDTEFQRPPLTRLLWLLLPACAVVLLMAVTNKLCQDVASVPFLWVVPLALYLMSFIICFDSPRWYARFPFTLGLVAALAAICWALFHTSDLSLIQQLVIYSGGLFMCCMVCHGELYRLRPTHEHLTLFYLMIAAGGALGGIFVGVIAPLIFRDYYELNWGLWVCGLLFLVVCALERNEPQTAARAVKAGSGIASRHSTGSAWGRTLGSLVNPAEQWRLMACTLPLFFFAGLDRFFAGFGQDLGHAPNREFTVLRAALWGLVILLGTSWVARGHFKQFRYWRGLACGWLGLGLAALGITLWLQGIKSGGGVISLTRNFYGVLTLYEYQQEDPKAHHLLLRHGRITHGFQFVDPEQARWPTAYYGETSGIGLAFRALPKGPRRIGLVGLGAGTLTAYTRPGDEVRIYEINPEVYRLARSRFAYLRNTEGDVQVVLGDARLSLEREPPQNFDLLALDAFNSDSIPVHLLTREAFALYQQHLKTNGVLAIHISNHFLDLEPVIARLAREFHYRLRIIDYEPTPQQWWLYPSTWAILCHDAQKLNTPEISAVARAPQTNSVPLWTDDFTSLFQILRKE